MKVKKIVKIGAPIVFAALFISTVLFGFSPKNTQLKTLFDGGSEPGGGDGGDGGNPNSVRATFVYPTQANSILLFSAGQLITAQVSNNNIFQGALLTQECNYAAGPWMMTLLPGGSVVRSYGITHTLPVAWKLTTSCTSSAANVEISASWF